MKPPGSSWEDCLTACFCIWWCVWAECKLPFTGCLFLHAAALNSSYAVQSTRGPTVTGARKARRFEMFSTTAPRLSLQIINVAPQDTDTSHRAGRAAGYIGRMITSPPVHEEKIYPNRLTLMTKEKSTRRPLGGSIGCGIYSPTVTCQVEWGTIWTYG